MPFGAMEKARKQESGPAAQQWSAWVTVNFILKAFSFTFCPFDFAIEISKRKTFPPAILLFRHYYR